MKLSPMGRVRSRRALMDSHTRQLQDEWLDGALMAVKLRFGNSPEAYPGGEKTFRALQRVDCATAQLLAKYAAALATRAEEGRREPLLRFGLMGRVLWRDAERDVTNELPYFKRIAYARIEILVRVGSAVFAAELELGPRAGGDFEITQIVWK